MLVRLNELTTAQAAVLRRMRRRGPVPNLNLEAFADVCALGLAKVEQGERCLSAAGRALINKGEIRLPRTRNRDAA